MNKKCDILVGRDRRARMRRTARRSVPTIYEIASRSQAETHAPRLG